MKKMAVFKSCDERVSLFKKLIILRMITSSAKWTNGTMRLKK